MLRVLFLDFDGVLNSSAYVRGADWEPPLGSDRDLNILDPDAIELLNVIVETTGAAVVITSSWRATYDEHALRVLLERRGFRGRVLGVTPQLPGRRRSREIAQWLADNPVAAFAIVDDDGEAAGAGHEPHFVQTTFDDDLTREHADRIVRVLGRR